MGIMIQCRDVSDAAPNAVIDAAVKVSSHRAVST